MSQDHTASLSETGKFLPGQLEPELDPLPLLEALIADAFDAMYILRNDGVFVAANPPAAAALQVPLAELIGIHFMDCFEAGDAKIALSLWEQMAISGRLDLLQEFTLRDGTRRLFQVHGRAHGTYFTFALRDQTPSQVRIRPLPHQEVDPRRIVDNLTELVCLFGPDGSIGYANTAYCQYFGRRQEDLLGGAYVPVVFAEDMPRVDAALATLAPDSPAVQIENRVYRFDGAVRWTQWINRAFYDEDGQLVEILATGRDIHEKRASQEELLVSEERFRLAARATRDYIWDWDVAHDQLTFGDQMRHLWPSGWPAPQSAFAWWSSCVHPDDRTRVIESLDATVAAPDTEYWSESYRFVREDGTWADIVDRGYVIRDARGRVVRMVGSMLDLTEHQQIQEQLAQTEAKLQITMQSTAAGLWEYEFRTNTVYRNVGLWDLLGLPPSDAPSVQEFWDPLVHPEDYDQYMSTWCEVLEQKLPTWSLEYRLQHASGRYLHVTDSAFIFYAADGEPIRAFGTVIDQTDRHERERELRARETTLARAQQIAHLGSWEVDLGQEPHRWSDEMFRIMGFEPGTVVPSMDLFWQHVHPDDVAGINAGMEAALAGTQPYRHIHRIVRPDGKIRWVNQQCEIDRTPDGSPTTLRGTCMDVTERMMAEAEIREREERFRSLADSSPAMIYLDDATGQREYLNVRWAEASGVPATDLQGRGWVRALHPADRLELEARLALALAKPQAYQFDYRLRFADGTWHWLLDTGSPRYAGDGTFLGYIGSCLDITPRKIAEDLQRFLAESGSLLTGSLDLDSSLVRLAQYCVPQLCDLCVLNFRNEATGQMRRLALAHADFRVQKALQDHLPLEPVDCLMQGGIEWVLRARRTLEVQNAQIDDHDRQLFALPAERQALTGVRSGIVVPLILRGQVLGTLSLLSSSERGPVLPEIRECAEEIARRIVLAVENARLYRALQVADHRKDLFLATLAHELRNPAAAILSAAQLLSIPDTDAETQRWGMELMERQARHIGRLLDDLLDVSRITRGKVQLRLEQVDLREIVTHALQTNRLLFEEKQQSVQLAMPDAPVLIVGDPTRLEQIVSNLLNNAAKYTGSNGHIAIQLQVEESTREAVLTIADNGIGIDPQLIPQLFEMFIQAERALDRSQGGLGIGLTLVRMLVEMHGGQVGASSAGPGHGSTFEVRLPIPSVLPPLQRDDRGTIAEMFEPLRILVIDDNVDVAQTMTRLIAARGHHVTALHESLSAVGAVESTKPDLVLLDIGMPGMDGYSVARRLQELPIRRNFLLIALTGFGQEDDTRLAAEAGFDGHRTKPLDRRELTGVLDLAQLHRRQHQQR